MYRDIFVMIAGVFVLASAEKKVSVDDIVAQGDIAEMARAIKSGVKPSCEYLKTAIEAQQEGMVTFLLDNQVSPNCAAYGFTQLFDAVSVNATTIVKTLLDRGADPNSGTWDSLYLSPLSQASTMNNSEVFEALLDAGANPNEVVFMGAQTILDVCAQLGQPAMVEALLAHGANPNGSGSWWYYPLIAAVVAGDLRSVELLVEAGATIDVGLYGMPALMWAAWYQHYETAAYLVSKGANPDQPGYWGWGGTARSYAESINDTKMITLFAPKDTVNYPVHDEL